MNPPMEAPHPPFRTLGGKLVGILVVFLLLALVTIGLTLLESWKLEGAAAAINDMGSERMRTYRIAYLVSEHARGVERDEMARQIRAGVAGFEATLQAVRRGDPARPLFLPDNPEIVARVDDILRQWNQVIRPALEAEIQAPLPDPGSAMRLRRSVDSFVTDIDDVVRALEKENAANTAWLRSFQFVLVSLAVFGTFGLIFLLYLLVMRPVGALQEGILRLEREDFSARVRVESRDEFGALARGFNKMAAHLEDLYATLEARVRDKTQRLEAKNRELGTLYEVTAALNEAPGAEELCRTFLRPLIGAFGAQAAAVRLCNPEDGRLHLFASEGLGRDLARAESCEHAARCVCGTAMERDAAIVTEVPAERQCASVGGFRTVGVFPVRYRHRLVGMCNLWFDTPRVIEERERKLIAVLGQHLGAALEAERLRSREKELAVSEERNLLAQELHDSIAQSLAFLNLQAQMLDAALVKGDIEEARAELAQIRAGVQESYDDVRELLTHFRTRMAELDLSGALRQAVSRFGGQTGIAIEFVESGAGIDPPPETQLQILHVVHECLSNVRKHSAAKHVTVLLERGVQYRFVVRDDGRGFDPDAVGSDVAHVGLAIMRERARRIGARLSVASRPGHGSEVVLAIDTTAERASGATGGAAAA
jgi:two-component system nitrate/nitrite sensor histidine kinase NarX